MPNCNQSSHFFGKSNLVPTNQNTDNNLEGYIFNPLINWILFFGSLFFCIILITFPYTSSWSMLLKIVNHLLSQCFLFSSPASITPPEIFYIRWGILCIYSVYCLSLLFPQNISSMKLTDYLFCYPGSRTVPDTW